MTRTRLLTGFLLPLVTASMSFGSPIVGTWYGRFDFSAAKPPTAEVSKQFSAMAAKSKNVKMTLEIHADKTFALTTTGLFPKPEILHGTWKQMRGKITLLGAGETKNLKQNPDGMSLYWALTDGFGAKVIFGHRAPKITGFH